MTLPRFEDYNDNNSDAIFGYRKYVLSVSVWQR